MFTEGGRRGYEEREKHLRGADKNIIFASCNMLVHIYYGERT